MKKQQTIVFGISSGIAAYKSIELINLLKKEGLEVFVIMTHNAAKMISPSLFRKASGNKVFTELFDKKFNYKNILKIRKVDHIDIADKADLFVIAPATANTIAKLAYGMADDFLTTSLLATRAPILICPSMNVHMWESSIVQKNITGLKSRGVHVLEPEEGQLACGYQGKGRLAHIEKIRDEVLALLKFKSRLSGQKIIVTAGPTIEKIDDVRFITNKSSGKMGVAIAEECYRQGAKVLLLRAKSSVSASYSIPEKIFETSAELEAQLKKYIPSSDIIFHTAAVSDFTVLGSKKGKLQSNKKLSFTFAPAKKIVNTIKKLNPQIKLISFKAEYGLKKDISKIVTQKFKETKSDVIVVNDISRGDRGFGVDTNEVIVFTKKNKPKTIPLSSKKETARLLIDFLFEQKIF